MIGIVVVLALSGAPAKADAGTQVPSVENKKLYDDFNTNEVAANRKYRNQILDVTGILERVEVDDAEGIVFRLVTSNRFMQTYAALDSDAAAKDDRIEKLTKGDKVVMRCACIGRTSGVPVLGGCVLKNAYRRTTAD